MNIVKKVSYAVATVVASSPLMALAADATTTSDKGGFDPTGSGAVGVPSATIKDILTNGMNWLLMIVGILGVIGFVIAGILYLTAAGDDTQIEKAKTAMMYSIVGVIVALLGVIIMKAVSALLGGQTASF